MDKELVVDAAVPAFSKIKINEAKKAVDEQLKFCRSLMETLLKQDKLTWSNFIHPMDEAEDVLSKTLGPISHMNAVVNSDELRDVHQYSIEKISEYSAKMSQDVRLLKAYQSVLDHDKSLDEPQRKAINDAIKNFKLSGVALKDEERKKFEEIAIQLTQLQNQFENNVLDATMAWHFETVNKTDLSGLSQEVLDQSLQPDKKTYKLGLDGPTYLAVMQQADNRDLRQKISQAFVSRASIYSENIEYDNQATMNEILKLRERQAQLLGFNNFASLSIETKMAGSVSEVMTFLEDLLERILPQAKQELVDLQSFANKNGFEGALQSWDIAYYSEKMKKSVYSFTEDEIKPYFPLNQVVKGLFEIIQSLYGIEIKKSTEWDGYHPQTALYDLHEPDGSIRGRIIIDLFAREHKRGGAWMDECRTRYLKEDKTLQVPVAYVVCNFMPPQGKDQALLMHSDVLTLFHEFGHALHHVLTKVDYLPISGINGVEWDAVELPSQFMENFCWYKDGLTLISKHVETGEPLSDKMFQKLVASRHYQSALGMLRQLEFSLFDMKLHQESAKEINVHSVLQNLRKQTALLEVPNYNRFENSFSHIFAGGYAAGYYSYKWAEVLSSDAFAVFERSHDIISAELGQKFSTTVLEKGGSKPAAELFENFKGAKASIESLLRHSGIKA